MSIAEKNEEVLAVLLAANEPLGPTEIGRRVGKSLSCYGEYGGGYGNSAAVTPVLRRINAIRHRGGKYTKPDATA